MLPMSDENMRNNFSSPIQPISRGVSPSQRTIEHIPAQENANPHFSQPTPSTVLAGQGLLHDSPINAVNVAVNPPMNAAVNAVIDCRYGTPYLAPPDFLPHSLFARSDPSAAETSVSALTNIFLSRETTSTELSEEDTFIMNAPTERMTSDLLDKVLVKSLVSGVNAKVIDSSYAYELVALDRELDNRLFADPNCMYVVPICDNTHWVLTVLLGVGTPDTRVLLLNSLNGNELGGLVTQFVALVCGADTEIIRPRVPQQAAGSEDCGFFVAYYACELMLQHRSVVQCSRAQLEAGTFWEYVFGAHDAVIDARKYINALFNNRTANDGSKLKRQRLPERKLSGRKRQGKGTRAKVIDKVDDRPADDARKLKRDGLKDARNLTRKSEIHREALKFRCDWQGCGAAYKYYTSLWQHRRVEHFKIEYKCKKCTRVFKSRAPLRRHESREHAQSSVEPEAEPEAESEAEPEAESEAESEEAGKKFQCTICPRKVSLSAYRSHMMVHTHEYLECPHCGRGLKTERTHNAHVLSHERPKRFKCRRLGCDEGFNTTQARLNHEREVHANVIPTARSSTEPEADELDADGNHLCKPCKKWFPWINYLSHMKVHTHGYHECPHCGNGLKTKKTLDEHVLAHERPTGFKCRVEGCSEGFSNYSARSGHEQKVHAEVPFKG